MTVSEGSLRPSSRLPENFVGRFLATPWRVFLTSFTLLFCVMAAWSLATPLFASPDEPSHVVRAVSLVRGELLGPTVKGVDDANTDVRIPQFYAEGAVYAQCYAFKDTVPASCNGPLKGSSREVTAETYVGHYPPLYYAFVGIPSLFTVSTGGLYAMRIMSDLLAAVYLALAIMAVTTWAKGRLLLLGLIVAVTPMTFFLSSVVNPSGLEIASATCLWCAGLILVLDRASDPPSGLIVVVFASATGLMLSRGLSLLWVLLIASVLAVCAGRRAVVDLARSRRVRWGLLVLVPAAIFAVTWVLVAHTLNIVPDGRPVGRNVRGVHLAAVIFGLTGSWLRGMIGVFGWLDTSSPLVTFLIWYGLLGFFILLGLVCHRSRRELAAPLLLILIVLAVPVAIAYDQAHRFGIAWQGRYIMPMAVGVPLLSVALIERSEILRDVHQRLALPFCALVGLGQICAFAQALRRYTVGLAGPLDFLHGSWQPPLGAPGLCALTVLGIALLMTLVYGLVRSEGPHGIDAFERSGSLPRHARDLVLKAASTCT